MFLTRTIYTKLSFLNRYRILVNLNDHSPDQLIYGTYLGPTNCLRHEAKYIQLAIYYSYIHYKLYYSTSKWHAFTQCRFNVGPTSATLVTTLNYHFVNALCVPTLSQPHNDTARGLLSLSRSSHTSPEMTRNMYYRDLY